MTDRNKLIVREFIETVINRCEYDQVGRFVSPGYIDHNNASKELAGIDGLIRHVRAVHATYPDLKIVIHEQIAERDMVATRISISGTHAGEWLGMKPTHKRVSIDAVNIDRIENGMIVEHRGMANTLEALLEIGAIPQLAQE